MADMGIGAGFGAGGAVDGLQEVLLRRLQERQFAEQQRAALAHEQLQQGQLAEQSKYRESQLDATKAYREGLLQDKQAKDYETGSKNAFAANEALGGGKSIDSTLQARFDKFGVPYDKGSLGSTSSLGVLALPGAPAPKPGSVGILSTQSPAQGPTTISNRKQDQSTAGIASKEGIAANNNDLGYYKANQQYNETMARIAARGNDQAHQDSRADKSYTNSTAALDKLGKGLDDKAASFTNLRQLLDAHNPQSDGLIAPLLLKTVAGGQGSGIRMNEAEIKRILGARAKEQDLEAFINHWTRANGAVQIPEQQRQQMYQIVGTLESKLARRRQLIDKAHQDLYNNQDSVDAHRRIVNDVTHALTAEDAAPGSGPSAPGAAPGVLSYQDYLRAKGTR